MDRRITLTGPARVDGKRFKAGETVVVDPEVAAQLPGGDAVSEITAIEAETNMAALEQALADRDAARARAAEAEAAVNRLEARVMELEAELADATAKAGVEADVTEDASSPAKATAKKGAGSKRG